MKRSFRSCPLIFFVSLLSAIGILCVDAANHVVQVGPNSAYVFLPPSISVNVFDSITFDFSNSGGIPHTATHSPNPGQCSVGPLFDSGLLTSGSFVVNVSANWPQNVSYICTYHCGIMMGKITVQDAMTNVPPSTTTPSATTTTTTTLQSTTPASSSSPSSSPNITTPQSTTIASTTSAIVETTSSAPIETTPTQSLSTTDPPPPPTTTYHWTVAHQVSRASTPRLSYRLLIAAFAAAALCNEEALRRMLMHD